jgi:uncharacterized protein (DUF302 family)
MNAYGQCVVIDSGFETVLGDVSRAIREEGLQTIARIDVRDHFWRDLGHDFRRYFLIEAWSPELALEALRHDLGIGTILPATLAIYELADGQTAVVAREPLSAVSEDRERLREAPDLATIADMERARMARIIARLRHTAAHQAPEVPAA